MDNSNICKNCKHFSQLYYWNKNHFTAAADGYCTMRVHRYKVRITKPANPACEFWEDNAEVIRERSRNIENALFYITKQLSDIALLLQAEKE